MNVLIPKTKLNHLIEFVIKNYETYGPVISDGKIIFDKLENSNDLSLFKEKTVLPFKKVLFPDNLDINSLKSDRKIALVGLNNCDIWALHRFLDQFKDTSILPSKNNILIIGSECKPSANCFCDLMGTNTYAPFDLFIQDEKNGVSVFSDSQKGDSILKTLGLKKGSSDLKLRKIDPNEKALDKKKLSNAVENKKGNIDFWQGISNNCFGCGSCSLVCPLCFCSRQIFHNDLEGNSTRCLKWDSCFSKSFSEIQHHIDYRDNNRDRLYNWYHHKFVRSLKENDYFLCTGCGRCIDACPARLNTKNILKALIEKND